jgi:hypothetical protein
LREVGILRLEDAPTAIQAQDVRPTAEPAEHEGESAILAQVGDGLNAAAGVVDVTDYARPEDAETVESLGREIDVASGTQRGQPAKRPTMASTSRPSATTGAMRDSSRSAIRARRCRSA